MRPEDEETLLTAARYLEEANVTADTGVMQLCAALRKMVGPSALPAGTTRAAHLAHAENYVASAERNIDGPAMTFSRLIDLSSVHAQLAAIPQLAPALAPMTPGRHYSVDPGGQS
jgi:hypothetical protein